MKKLNNISFIKTIVMLLVVLYHSMLFYTGNWLININPLKIISWVDYLTSFINTYTMPMFVFCSGYLFFYQKINYNKYTNPVKDIKNRFNRLIIPYISTSIFWIIPIGVLLLNYNINDIVEKFALGLSPSQLWFLLMLFFVFLIMYFISSKLKFTKKEFIVVICVSLILNYLSKYIPNYYQLNVSFNYLLYYYFGGYICSRNLKLKYKKIINISMVLLSLCSYIILKVIPNIGYFHYLLIICKPFVVLIGTFALYVNFSSCNFRRLNNNKLYKIFENNSFGIYLFHQQIIYFVIYAFNEVLNPMFVILLSFVFSLIISNLIVSILRKYKPTKFMFGL